MNKASDTEDLRFVQPRGLEPDEDSDSVVWCDGDELWWHFIKMQQSIVTIS